jgi:hypothetical protein
MAIQHPHATRTRADAPSDAWKRFETSLSERGLDGYRWKPSPAKAGFYEAVPRESGNYDLYLNARESDGGGALGKYPTAFKAMQRAEQVEGKLRGYGRRGNPTPTHNEPLTYAPDVSEITEMTLASRGAPGVEQAEAYAAALAEQNEAQEGLAMYSYGTFGVDLSGAKYARVYQDFHGNRSVVMFVDKQTGDAFQPKGWKHVGRPMHRKAADIAAEIVANTRDPKQIENRKLARAQATRMKAAREAREAGERTNAEARLGQMLAEGTYPPVGSRVQFDREYAIKGSVTYTGTVLSYLAPASYESVPRAVVDVDGSGRDRVPADSLRPIGAVRRGNPVNRKSKHRVASDRPSWMGPRTDLGRGELPEDLRRSLAGRRVTAPRGLPNATLYQMPEIEQMAISRGGWTMTPEMRVALGRAIARHGRGLARPEIGTIVRRIAFAHESPGERRAYRSENPILPTSRTGS